MMKKEKISYYIYQLKVQEERLEQAYNRMKIHYSELSKKVSRAVESKDSALASMYGSECTSIKKMGQLMAVSKEIIHSIVLRLEQDGTEELKTVINALQVSKSRLAGVIPEVSYRLGMTIDGFISLTGEEGSIPSAFTKGSVTDKIIDNAQNTAEERIKTDFANY